MDNYKIRIDFKKLAKAEVRKDGEGNDYVLIPCAENHIYVNERVAYLDMAMRERKEPGQKGETHFIKQDLGKVWREAHHGTYEPIVGNATPYEYKPQQPQPQAQPVPQMTAPAEPQIGDTNDLPF